MKQFAIERPLDVKIGQVKPGREKIGKRHVSSLALRCSFTASNTILDQFKPELREALYVRAKEAAQQPELDGVEAITDTPLLRVNNMAPVHFNDELTGYTATFDLGLGRKESQIVLNACKLNAIAIDALQGGSVKVSFRIQASSVSKRDIGELGFLVGADVALMLAPPIITDPIDGTVGPGATGNTEADAKEVQEIRKPTRKAPIAKKIAAAAKRQAAKKKAKR